MWSVQRVEKLLELGIYEIRVSILYICVMKIDANHRFAEGYCSRSLLRALIFEVEEIEFRICIFWPSLGCDFFLFLTNSPATRLQPRLLLKPFQLPFL